MRVWGMYGALKWKVISNFFNATNSYKIRKRNGSLTNSTVERPYLCSDVFKRTFRRFPCVEADSRESTTSDNPSYTYDNNLAQWIKIFQFVESAEGADEFLHILVRKSGLIKSNVDLNHWERGADQDTNGLPSVKWRVLDPQAAVSQSRQEAKELFTSATMRRFSGLGKFTE